MAPAWVYRNEEPHQSWCGLFGLCPHEEFGLCVLKPTKLIGLDASEGFPPARGGVLRKR